MSSAILSLLSFVICLYAALLWLQPTRSNALRSALIVLPAGFLLYLMGNFHLSGKVGVLLQGHLLRLAPLLVFLLGNYALHAPKKQAFLAVGVWGLTFCLVQNITTLLFRESIYPDSVAAMLPLSTVLWLAYTWLFVRGGAGKHNISKSQALLTAGVLNAVYPILSSYLNRLAVHLYSLLMQERHTVLSMTSWTIIWILEIGCFAAILHYVWKVTVKRSLTVALLYHIPFILCQIGLMLYFQQQPRLQ